MKHEKKTTLTVHYTLAELKTNLNSYQIDTLHEIFTGYMCGGKFDRLDAVKFAKICMDDDVEFDDLVEKTNAQWISTPVCTAGWVNCVRNFPYLFGITDQDVTKDVTEVILDFEGFGRFDVSELIKHI